MQVPVPHDDAGPTPERLHKAGQFFRITGRGKSNQRFNMTDDALGRAWARSVVSGEEHSALRRYALHWLAGGLQGPLSSVDLNRVYSFDPSQMSGLARSESQLDHKRTFYAAQDWIGFNPAYVATQVACFGRSLQETGLSMGLKSRFRAREKAGQYLGSAGAGLIIFFNQLKPR
jgi:hypothetical protein